MWLVRSAEIFKVLLTIFFSQAIMMMFQAKGIRDVNPNNPALTMAFKNLSDQKKIKEMHRNQEIDSYMELLLGDKTYITFVEI